MREAANNVSEGMCAKLPEIDFKGWANVRHRLVHDYANIDLNIVWNAVCDDLPKLEKALKPVVEVLSKVQDAPDNIGEYLWPAAITAKKPPSDGGKFMAV